MGAKIEKAFGIIVIVFPTIAIVVGSWLVWGQHQKLVQYQPVEATVLGKKIGERRGSEGGTSYYPIVEYEYHIAGERYSNDAVFPISINSHRSWARGVIEGFDVGSRVEAFCSPKDPRQAYLIREATFVPYVFILFPMIFVAIGVAILGYGRGRPALRPLRPLAGGRVSIGPQLPLSKRLIIAGAMAALWYGLGGSAIAHYYTLAESPYGWFAHIGSSIYLLIGLIPLSMFRRRWRIVRSFADASLHVDADRFAPGDTVTVVAEQLVRSSGHVTEMELALVQQIHSRSSSGGKTTHTTTHRDLDRQAFEQQRNVLPGDFLSASASFTIPKHAPPTSPASALANPLYDYYIEVVTRMADQPEYAGRFAFCLESTAARSGRGGADLRTDRPTGRKNRRAGDRGRGG